LTITIKESKTADSRTCGDPATVTKEILAASSEQHIEDVGKGLEFIKGLLDDATKWHDFDKLSYLHEFHADFQTGFEKHDWWDQHKKISRHHLSAEEGVPEDVDLIDVLEFIVDCVMAGMARSGSVYDLELPSGLLDRAFRNTVELLKAEVVVEKEDSCNE